MSGNSITITEVEQALICMRVRFQPSEAAYLDWPAKTFLAKLANGKPRHLSDLHIWAWDQILIDYEAMCGGGPASTGHLVREPVDCAFNPFKMPVKIGRGYSQRSEARLRLDRLGDALTDEERAILADLWLDFRDRRDGAFVQWIGLSLSSFRDRAQLRSLAVGKVTSLLNRVALHYGRQNT